MHLKNKKLSKRRTIRKNIKKTKNSKTKLLSKMRGGSAAAASTSSSCFTPGDNNLFQFGIPNEKYLSTAQYISGNTMYSDHAPIIYNFANAPDPITNLYISIITWNVGMRGEKFESKDKQTGEKRVSYTHKFNMMNEESIDNYKIRLQNLVDAMADLLNNNYPTKGNNHPFLFCQELPSISKKKHYNTLRELFKTLLANKSLEILCDSTDSYEFGLIVKIGSRSQRFTVLNKSDYWDTAYSNNKLIFPRDKSNTEWRRFEIYYYEFCVNTYYYVNIHAQYTKKPSEIVDFLNRIVDTIQVYRTNKGMGIDNVTIYLIGDYNYNIASPEINTLIKTNYSSNPLLLFANKYLRRNIKSMYKLTTQNAKGYSLIDNKGKISDCNIDCILKLDLASA
jgi:hypothetical protein